MHVLLSDGPRCGDVLDLDPANVPEDEAVCWDDRLIFGYDARGNLYCYVRADYTTSAGMPVFEWEPYDPYEEFYPS